MTLQFAVIYGSVRQTDRASRPHASSDTQLARRGHETTLVDRLEIRLPLLDRMYKEYPKGAAPRAGAAGAALSRGRRVRDRQRRIQSRHPASAEEPARPFPGGVFLPPLAIVCYSAGGFGGVRAAMQLRMTLAELGMVTIPSLFPVPKVQDAFDEAGQATDPGMERRAQRFLDELEWYARALPPERANGTERTAGPADARAQHRVAQRQGRHPEQGGEAPDRLADCNPQRGPQRRIPSGTQPDPQHQGKVGAGADQGQRERRPEREQGRPVHFRAPPAAA